MKKDIAIGVLCFTVVIVYVLGMILWPYMPKEDVILNKPYYITTSSVLYIMSVIISIISNTKAVKVGSFAMMGVFSVNLYVELFLNPVHWTNWDLGLLIFVPLNLFLMVTIIEKLKNKKT